MTWPTALVIVACLGFVFGVLCLLGHLLSVVARPNPPAPDVRTLPRLDTLRTTTRRERLR